MIIEPYDIRVIDLEKDDCSYVNDVLRVGGNDYYRLISGSYKLDKGHFVKIARAPISVTLIHREISYITSFGTFVRVRNMLFLEEELANYYA